MEKKVVHQSPFVSLAVACVGAIAGIIVANVNFEDASVRLGARVLFSLLGFMAAYALATWYFGRQGT
jgi:hypothetical protein